MALVLTKLKKGETLNLTKPKNEPQITKVRLGLGWAFKPGHEKDDLDASAILLGSNNKMWAEDSLVFYLKLVSADNAIKHWGDIRGAAAGDDDGDDEMIDIDLSKVSADTQTILLCVTSYSEDDPIIFGSVEKAYVSLRDISTCGINQSNGEIIGEAKELGTFDLNEDASINTSLEMAKIYRTAEGWNYQILANPVGVAKNGLEDIVNKYCK